MSGQKENQLAKVGNFLFSLNQNDITAITHQLTFDWHRQERLGNHALTQNRGQWEETITFSGKLLLQSINALDDFEDMAKAKQPVRLTLNDQEHRVVITALERTKSGFMKSGAFRYQEYSITMQRYF